MVKISFREQICEWCKKKREMEYALIKREITAYSFNRIFTTNEIYYFCNKQHLINFLIGKKLPKQIIKRIIIKMQKEDIRKVIFSKEVINSLAKILEARIKEDIFSKEVIDTLAKILELRLKK